MCSEIIKRVVYTYSSQQYVVDYVPPLLTVCKKCLYREVYGSKNYRKQMKEGVLENGKN